MRPPVNNLYRLSILIAAFSEFLHEIVKVWPAHFGRAAAEPSQKRTGSQSPLCACGEWPRHRGRTAATRMTVANNSRMTTEPPAPISGMSVAASAPPNCTETIPARTRTGAGTVLRRDTSSG